MSTRDDDNRWETVNLEPDQFEQVLSTDMVETIQVDPELVKASTAAAGSSGAGATGSGAIRSELPDDRGYGLVLLWFALAIGLGGAALLLRSGFWAPSGSLALMILCGLGSVGAGALAVYTLLRRLRLIGQAE